MMWHTDSDKPFEKTAHYRIVCGLLSVWWIGFVLRALDSGGVASNLSRATASTEQGSAANQMLVFVLFALGLYHLPRAWRVLQSPEARNLILILLAYVTWSGSSVLWSEDPSLTIRRYSAFLLMLVGCVGVGAGFYSRTSGGVETIAKHVFFAAAVTVSILLPTHMSKLTTADLLNPKFNLKDDMNIAIMTHPVGYGCLAAIVLFRIRPIARWVSMLLGIAVLALLKGRTMLGDVVAASMILGSRAALSLGIRKILMSVGVVLTLILADLGTGGRLFISYILSALDQLEGILPWLSNGEGLKNLTSLSGRVPLWNVLYNYVAERPIAGNGFGAFWNAEHLEQVYTLAGWRAVVAHNGFVDELLATGIIGLLLFLLFWGYAMVLGLRVSREAGTLDGYLVSSWLMLFLLFNTMDSVMQTYFQVPSFISLIGLFTMMRTFSGEAAEWAGAPVGQPFMLRKVGI